jgi:hypothetical protein
VNFFSVFALSFGLMLALAASIAAWLFRTSGAPLIAKLAIPAVLTALACITPLQVNSMMGLPVTASFDDLPDNAELIAFVANDDAHSVDMWLESGGPPRAYEAALDEGLRKTLRQAREELEKGLPVMLRKRGGEASGDSRRSAMTNAATDGHLEYEIDSSAFGLPPKE